MRAKEAAKQRLEEIENERKELRASLKSLDAALKAITKPSRIPRSKATCTDEQIGIDASDLDNVVERIRDDHE